MITWFAAPPPTPADARVVVRVRGSVIRGDDWALAFATADALRGTKGHEVVIDLRDATLTPMGIRCLTETAAQAADLGTILTFQNAPETAEGWLHPYEANSSRSRAWAQPGV